MNRKTRPLILCNHKGGVGKSLEALLLGAALAMMGRKVLLIDLDPQGNLTRRLGYLEEFVEQRPSMAEAIYHASPDVLRSTLLPCQWEPEWAENITLAPARIELENRVPEAGVPGSHLRLRNALAPLLDEYDDVIIDVAPTLGHLLHLALACRAADEEGVGVDVLAVMTPDYDGLRGVRRLEKLMNDPDYQIALNMNDRLIGVVINKVRYGVVTHQTRIAEAEATWGDLLWGPYLSLMAGTERAIEFSEPPQLAEDLKSRLAMTDAGKAHVERYLAATGQLNEEVAS